jgi:hypothetical protein
MSDEHKKNDKYPIKELKPRTTNIAKKTRSFESHNL